MDGLLSMNPIIDTPFVDLYLGPDFTDVKGLDGQSGRVEAPEAGEKAPSFYGRNAPSTLKSIRILSSR
ncbi:Type II secretion system protein E [Pseudomonas syringae pv. spinaceae]|uniref:Type II secretion system protein E n=1 Tax=Pseudomonas syringae pv. spinaceae TaxID=264459 RepID=A0A0Q0G8B4_PSESX|nr:Type II secretion system protein E [Pseudomonas syringae pv. spinaceae]